MLECLLVQPFARARPAAARRHKGLVDINGAFVFRMEGLIQNTSYYSAAVFRHHRFFRRADKQRLKQGERAPAQLFDFLLLTVFHFPYAYFCVIHTVLPSCSFHFQYLQRPSEPLLFLRCARKEKARAFCSFIANTRRRPACKMYLLQERTAYTGRQTPLRPLWR